MLSKCYFAFPNQARDRVWISRFNKEDVHFFNFSNYKEFSREISKITAIQDIDIIHAHFVTPNKLKTISCRTGKIKIFVHLHSDFSSGHKSIKSRIREYLTYHVLTSKMTFLCVSQEFVKRNPKNSIWIPNAVVCDMIERNPADKRAFRDKYDIDPEKQLVELYGWSPEVKGVDVAVEAIKKANTEQNKFTLMIVCGMQYNEIRMKQYVAEHTSCTGNEDYLIFVPPIEDVYTYHFASDILLSASRSEGFPYSIIEMLSLGKKCVVSDIPGTAWSKHYDSVVSFANESHDDCARALIEASKLVNYFPKVKNAVREEYSIDKWVDEILESYTGREKG